MPPVLHVAFDELARGGEHDMGAAEIRPRIQQRQRVLQLIAESERAAWLVRPTARPDPATERLIQQPAVHQQIERIVGRMHLDRAERVVPEPFRARDRIVDGGEARVACGELSGLRGGGALTEHEGDAP